AAYPAERNGVPMQTVIQTRNTIEKAICDAAAKGASLVVMGVRQRPGKELFFGDTITAVLLGCRCPVILIAAARVILDDAEQEARRAGIQQSGAMPDAER